MKLILLFLAIMIMVFSCGGEATDRVNAYSEPLRSREDSLFHEVMKGHDVGMAKMLQIRRYLKELNTTKDSLRRLKKDLSFNNTIESELKEAEERMNKWMREFRIDTLKDNTDARLRYLEEEKQKVIIVRDGILNSIRRYDSAFKVK